MIHLGDNRTVNERDVVAVVPQTDSTGKQTAAVYLADGTTRHSSVLALTIRARLKEAERFGAPAEKSGEKSVF